MSCEMYEWSAFWSCSAVGTRVGSPCFRLTRLCTYLTLKHIRMEDSYISVDIVRSIAMRILWGLRKAIVLRSRNADHRRDRNSYLLLVIEKLQSEPGSGADQETPQVQRKRGSTTRSVAMTPRLSHHKCP